MKIYAELIGDYKNQRIKSHWDNIKSNEASQDLIQGLTLSALYIDEVVLINKSFYYQALGRLSVDGAKCFLNCNPSSPYHWFYKENLLRAEENEVLYIHFTMDDNLSLSEEVKARYEQHFKGVFYERNILGKWVAAEGLVYSMWNNKVNLIKPQEIPYEEIMQWCIGVDYGTANPTVFLLIGKTLDGTIYVCKEYYYDSRVAAIEMGDADVQKTDREYEYDLRKFITDVQDLTLRGYREIPIIIDPSAASFKTALRRERYKTKNADNEVIDGVREVSTLMGEGMLKVSTECENLINEIHLYSWDQRKQEKGIDMPLKENDHACITGDTLINTVDGYTQIKDLVGKTGFVNTIDPVTHENIVCRFDNVVMTLEDAEIIEIEFDNGEILKITENHPILTSSGWKPAGELTEDDDVVALAKNMKIEKLKKLDRNESVYNMTVDDVNCYSATKSNIILHNCDALRYGCMYYRNKTRGIKSINLGW